MRTRVRKEQELVRFAVRLPKELHQAIERGAKYYDRSLNYEIETRLRASLTLDKILDAKTTMESMEMLEKLRRRLRDLRLEEER